MKKIKVRFKANLSGYKTGDIAEVSEDFVRRAGNEVEIIEETAVSDKKIKLSNKSMNKKQLKTK